MLSKNTRKTKSLLCCIQNVIEAKVHDLCVTIVGVALSFICVTRHFMQSSGWRIGKHRLVGLVVRRPPRERKTRVRIPLAPGFFRGRVIPVT